MLYDCPKYVIKKSVDIDSITSIHYFEFDDKFIDSPESHEPWELVYIDRGECNIIANGETFLLKQGEMYFHKPYENHMLRTIKGIAPNVFIIVFSSKSQAMRYFENRKLEASMTTKQHIAAIIHEASSTFDLPFNNPRMQQLKPSRKTRFGAETRLFLFVLSLCLLR